MWRSWKILVDLWKDEDAQDLIEYALTASFVAVAVAFFFPTTISPNISAIFSKVVSSLSLAGQGS
jgi:Flp pilus assembly pilin Flp